MWSRRGTHQLPEKGRRTRMKFGSWSTSRTATPLATARSGRGIQGRRAAGILRVEFCAMIGKELNDFVPAPACGAMERRLAAAGFRRIDIGATLQKSIQGLDRSSGNVLR